MSIGPRNGQTEEKSLKRSGFTHLVAHFRASLLSIRSVWNWHFARYRIAHVLSAVHAGTLAHRSDLGLAFGLRRTIHMLEKVVADPNLRTERTDALAVRVAKILTEGHLAGQWDQGTTAWAVRVVSVYASRQPADHPSRKAAWQCQRILFEEPLRGHEPYRADHRPSLTVRFSDILCLSRRRRSIRRFQDRQVPLADVRRAMEVALQSPSACNRQPFLFRHYSDPAIVAAIADAAPGVKGLTFPAMMLITVRFRAYHDAREFLCPFVDAAQAAMAFQFALETLGASSLCINWPTDAAADRRLREVVKLEKDECVVMRLAIGYAELAGMVASSSKKPVSSILIVE